MAKKTKNTSTSNEPIIGMFYQTPAGKIIYTYMGGPEGIGAYEEGKSPRQYSYAEMANMKPLPKIRDFPNAQDPRLPYVYDLHWDIKRVSELKRAIEEDTEVLDVLRTHVPKNVADLSGNPNHFPWKAIAQYFREQNLQEFIKLYGNPPESSSPRLR